MGAPEVLDTYHYDAVLLAARPRHTSPLWFDLFMLVASVAVLVGLTA